MKLDFLTHIIEWAKRPEVSIAVKAIIQVLVVLASLLPGPAAFIMSLVASFYDTFDAKIAAGETVSVDEKRAATESVVTQTMSQYHGSGSLLSESWVRATTALFVHVLGVIRYGEDTVRNEQAVIKGYMSTSEDIQNALKTHAGFKLFGV